MFLTKHKLKSSGFALATTIVVLGILLMLSASYLISTQCDNNFTKLQEAHVQAAFLARSGIQYYIEKCVNSVPLKEGGKLEYSFPDGNKFIEIKLVKLTIKKEKKYVSSTGIIKDSAGKEIARSTIIAPTYGNEENESLLKWFEI